LDLESGGSLGVTWGNEWACWGLSFKAGLLPHEDCRTADVTLESRWHSLLGIPVTNVEIEWTPHGELERPSSHYPTVARVGFEGGRNVYLSALQIQGHRLTADDHITVDFDGEVVREMNLWSR
jgi:Mor family transcriptional regulator